MRSETPYVPHICPVCGHAHAVHPVLDRLSYGRQLTCSPVCKTRYRKLILTRAQAGGAGNSAQDGAQ